MGKRKERDGVGRKVEEGRKEETDKDDKMRGIKRKGRWQRVKRRRKEEEDREGLRDGKEMREERGRK